MERDVRDGTVSPQVEPNEARAGSKSTGVCAHMHGRKSGGSIVKRVSADKSCDYPPILCHSEERLRQSKAPLLEMEGGGVGGGWVVVGGYQWRDEGGQSEPKPSRGGEQAARRWSQDVGGTSGESRVPAAGARCVPARRPACPPRGTSLRSSAVLFHSPPPRTTTGGGRREGGVQIIHRECF